MGCLLVRHAPRAEHAEDDVNVLKRLRTQDAVYWAPLGKGTDTGQEEYADPVDIKCRWADDWETVVMIGGSEGNINAVVDCDRVLEKDGLLRKGTVDDLDEATLADPFATAGTWKIRRFARVPKVRAKDDTDPDKTLMRAFL